MAIQRYISTSFWDDAWIQTLDPSEKLLYLYLMTNPLTNIAGVYKITKRRMSFDTGYNIDTLDKILERFQRDGKAYLYGEYMIIPSWPKHQQYEKRSKIRAGIEKTLEIIPDEVKKYMVSIGYAYPIKGYEYGSNYSDLDLDLDLDSDINNNTPPSAPATPPAAQVGKIKKLSPMKNPVAQLYQERFTQIFPDTGWSDYAKERAQLNTLAKKTTALRPQTPYETDHDLVNVVIKSYLELIQTGKGEYWKNAPVIPSALCCRWSEVITNVAKNYEQDEINVEKILF
jgi:hypothetical protein